MTKAGNRAEATVTHRETFERSLGSKYGLRLLPYLAYLRHLPGRDGLARVQANHWELDRGEIDPKLVNNLRLYGRLGLMHEVRPGRYAVVSPTDVNVGHGCVRFGLAYRIAGTAMTKTSEFTKQSNESDTPIIVLCDDPVHSLHARRGRPERHVRASTWYAETFGRYVASTRGRAFLDGFLDSLDEQFTRMVESPW